MCFDGQLCCFLAVIQEHFPGCNSKSVKLPLTGHETPCTGCMCVRIPCADGPPVVSGSCATEILIVLYPSCSCNTLMSVQPSACGSRVQLFIGCSCNTVTEILGLHEQMSNSQTLCTTSAAATLAATGAADTLAACYPLARIQPSTTAALSRPALQLQATPSTTTSAQEYTPPDSTFTPCMHVLARSTHDTHIPFL